MSLNYSIAGINARLGGVVAAIDSGGGPGGLEIRSSSGVLLILVSLAVPSGVVAGGVLTFTAPIATTGLAFGVAHTATITNSAGVLMVSNLTLGIPGSGGNLIINNSHGNLICDAGSPVTLVSGTIVGA